MHQDTTNKPIRRISTTQIIKVSFAVLALIVAYLFALNGRYIKVEDDYYFDKWTRTLLIIDKEKVIE